MILNEGENATDYKFTGKELDETGLYFYGARYYDAQLGRFVTADSVDPDIDKPQSLSRYTYCLNNPLIYIDPSGNWPISEEETRDDNSSKGWASSLASKADIAIEEAFKFYYDKTKDNWAISGSIATGADVLKGSVDLLRLGESSSAAIDYIQEGNTLMAVAKFSEDISRAASIAAIAGSIAQSARPYHQYYPKDNPAYSSRYLTRGKRWSAPHKTGKEAYKALNLEKSNVLNPGDAVKSVHPNFKPVRGPRPVKGGTGSEYYIGWKMPKHR